jgi:hypothetical protein
VAGRDHMEALTRLYNVADRSRREGGAFVLPPRALEALHELVTPCETPVAQACATIMGWSVSFTDAVRAHGVGSAPAQLPARQLGAVALTRAYAQVAHVLASARQKGVPLARLNPELVIEAALEEQRHALLDAWNTVALALNDEAHHGGR